VIDKDNEMRTLYSINDEDYIYHDPDGALDALDSDGLLEDGAVYYEADFAPVDLSRYLRAERLLEDADERLYDDVGESAEDAYSVTPEALAELDAAIKAWCEQYLANRSVWEIIGKSREIRVSAKNVSDYHGRS